RPLKLTATALTLSGALLVNGMELPAPLGVGLGLGLGVGVGVPVGVPAGLGVAVEVGVGVGGGGGVGRQVRADDGRPEDRPPGVGARLPVLPPPGCCDWPWPLFPPG